jgi:hypothetical protein
VVTSAGGVKCWGFGLEGQLGDGATTSRATPVAVSGLSSGVAAVAAGGHHTCALMASGSVKCWGYNAFGQLGDGTTTDRTTPVSVSGLPGAATALSAGADHTCALLGTGGVTCWGFNVSGQLGDGSLTSRPTPTAVSGLSSGVTEISAGADHTCAVAAGGLVKCWGSNGLGRLGDGSTTDRRTPVAVLGLSAASAVSGGADHTCAVTSGGSARCWGGNALGQVGDGTTDARTTAVGVVGLAGDERPPSVSLVLTDPNGGVPDGANGWFVHGPVSGTVTADDSANGGSDITAIDCAGATVEASVGLGTPTASASFSIVSEGRRSVTCTATDAAGNTSDPTVLSVNLDVTPPSVLVAVVPRLIFLHGTATRSADATDNIGPVTRHCLYRFDADSVGRKAFTCEARDEAGNVATSTVYYVVRYRLLSFAPPEGSRFRVGSKVRIFVALGGNTGIKIRNALASAIVSECAVTVTFRGLPPANHCVRYAPIARVFKATFATGPALRRGAHTIILAIALPGDVVQRATRTVIMTS